MKRYTQVLLQPATQQGLSARAVALLRENTLRLMQRGFRIPVLPAHAAAGSIDGGPQLAPVRAVGRPAPVGRLVDLVQLPDGSLAQVIESPHELPVGMFTSPEIRPHWVDPAGRRHGPIIAHIALTDRPLSRGQTQLKTLNENESPHFPLFRKGAANMNPTTDRDTTESIALPEQHEEISPEDVEIIEPETPPHENPETDAFPEEDTVLADPQDVASESPATQSADRVNFERRAALAERIRGSRKLPKGLRDRLAEVVETLQLSAEADDVPRVPVAEAVEMIEAAIPENLQFHEGPLESPAHPRGEAFFTGGASQLSSEDAQRIAKEQLAATGFGQT